MPTITLTATKDAAAEYDPNPPSGSVPSGGMGKCFHLPVGNTVAYLRRSFLSFGDITTTNLRASSTAIPWSSVATITSATLYLYTTALSDGSIDSTTRRSHTQYPTGTDLWNGTGSVYIDRVTQTWSEGTAGADEVWSSTNGGGLEWDTMPSVSTAERAEVNVVNARPTRGTEYQVDITSIVRKWAATSVSGGGGLVNYGVRLLNSAESTNGRAVEFYSREAASSTTNSSLDTYAPKLVITYTEPAVELLTPTAAIGLPNGTSASGLGTITNLSDSNIWTPSTALALTTLSWTSAPSVGTALQGWRLKIYTDAALATTPIFDSGDVVNSAHILDTSYTLTSNALKPSWVPGSGWLTASGYDGLVNGTQYYQEIEIWDDGPTTLPVFDDGTFKLRWGQASYEFDAGAGATSGWAVDYDLPAIGTQIGVSYQASGYKSQAKVTNMVPSGTSPNQIVTITCADGHSFIVGDVINITAASPSTYNLSAQTVLATGLTATAFTISNTLAASPAYAAGTVAYASLLSYSIDQTGSAYVKPLAASITAVSSTTTLITYTASNSFIAGQRVTVTGCSTAAHNVSNALISTRSGSQFTVVITGGTVASSTTGTATMHGRRGLNAPITGVTASGTAITYSSPTHTFVEGQVVDISGITPSGFNLTGATIASVVAATSFTIASTVTGTYTRGGNATPKVFSSPGDAEGQGRYLVANIRTSVDNGSTTKPVVKNLSFSYLSGLQLPDNWASETGTNYYLDANTRRFGTKAAKVEVTLAPDGFIYPNRGVTPSDISVVANTTYSFSTYVKFDSPTGANNVRLRVYPAGTIYPASATILADSGPHTDFPADTEGWRRLSVTFRTGGSTTYVRPMIYMVNTAGSLVDFFWVDGVLFEEGTVVRSWTPGFVTSGMTFEGGGMNIDSSAGGVLRLRGSDGGPRDEVTTGTNGLNFGGATSAVQVYSGSASTLNISGGLAASGAITSAGLSLMSNPMTAVGDIIVGTTAGAPTRVASVAGNLVLRSTAAATAPSYGGDFTATTITGGTTEPGQDSLTVSGVLKASNIAFGYHNFNSGTGANFSGAVSVGVSITVPCSAATATITSFGLFTTQWSTVPHNTSCSWENPSFAGQNLTGFTLWAHRVAAGALGVSWMVIGK
jgi:hypothetical protein